MPQSNIFNVTFCTFYIIAIKSGCQKKLICVFNVLLIIFWTKSKENKMSHIRTSYFLNFSTSCEISSTDSSSRPVTSTLRLSVMPKR